MFCVRLHEELKRRRMMNSFQRNAFLIRRWRKKRAGYAKSGVPRSSQGLHGLRLIFSTCLQASDQEAQKGGHKEPVGTHGLSSLLLLARSV